MTVLRIWGVMLVAALSAQLPPSFTVITSVAQGRGEPVTNLAAADFIVRLGETERTVIAVAPDPRPLAIVVMMDGVESQDALYARATLSAVVKRLRQAPGTRIGLMLGEGGARVPLLQDALDGADALNRRISRFFRSEVTAPPQDLLAGAIEALAREETHRRVALVLSVNRRTDRVEIPASLIPAMRTADVTLVALEASSRVGSVDPALRMIQAAVGGRFEQVADITAFESAALRLTSSVMSAYRVTFAITEPAGGALRVSVKAPPRAIVIAPAWASR